MPKLEHPSPKTEPAAEVGPAAPVQASLTRRSTSETLRALAQQEASVLVAGQLARRQEEWRVALASVRHTLADLEAMGEAANSASADAVSELIEKIVAAAAADAQQLETDARAALAEAQALTDRLQAEVRAGQEQLQLAREALEIEQAARVRADAAAKDAEAAHGQARSALETQLRSREAELQSTRSELAAVDERLTAAQAERANLEATLETLQRAVHGAVSTLSVVQPAASTPPRVAPQTDSGRTASSRVPVAGANPPAISPSSSTPEALRADSLQALPADRPPNVGVYVTALLDSVEAMYAQDVESALAPAEVVRRLRDNLRYASRLLSDRLGSDAAADNRAFGDAVAALLSSRSATPFGRDLSVAVGEVQRRAM